MGNNTAHNAVNAIDARHKPQSTRSKSLSKNKFANEGAIVPEALDSAASHATMVPRTAVGMTSGVYRYMAAYIG